MMPEGVLSLTPGDRVRLTMEGTAVLGDDKDKIYVRMDDGSLWWCFPQTANVEVITRPVTG